MAPATAIPTSDLFSAGASLTPSPVIPTLNPIYHITQKNIKENNRTSKKQRTIFDQSFTKTI